MTVIRAGAPGDIAAIRRVNELAFGQPVEAGVVDALRANCEEILLLVVADDEENIGYIVFSSVVIERHVESRTARPGGQARGNAVESSAGSEERKGLHGFRNRDPERDER